MFIDEETGDFLLQGWTVTDPTTLAESGTHSPLADNESLVRLPARMRAILLEDRPTGCSAAFRGAWSGTADTVRSAVPDNAGGCPTVRLFALL